MAKISFTCACRGEHYETSQNAYLSSTFWTFAAEPNKGKRMKARLATRAAMPQELNILIGLPEFSRKISEHEPTPKSHSDAT